MLRIPKDIATRIDEVSDAWEKMRPNKVFYDMTLEQFRQAVKPYLDACTELVELEARTAQAVAKKELAATAAIDVVQCVVNAVKGDSKEGHNGELYAAMGYVPKSQRSTGLVRRKKGEPAKAEGSAA